jgi:acetyl-CoA carboxylase carboxyltransferase component
MKKLVDQLNTITNNVLEGGKSGLKARLRHTEKGKLLARDRIKYLLDHK